MMSVRIEPLTNAPGLRLAFQALISTTDPLHVRSRAQSAQCWESKRLHPIGLMSALCVRTCVFIFIVAPMGCLHFDSQNGTVCTFAAVCKGSTIIAEINEIKLGALHKLATRTHPALRPSRSSGLFRPRDRVIVLTR